LQWFLQDWHAGRMRQALNGYAGTHEGSEERAIISFWLDPRQTFEQLRSRLPDDAICLAHYAVAEREAHNRHTKAAITAMDQTIATLSRRYQYLKDGHLPIRRAELVRMDAATS